MSNKVAIVTGANKGIGFAMVKGLCEEFDGIVYLTSRDETRGLDAVENLKKLGYHPRYHQLDINNDESINQFCSYIFEKHKHVDILINNAGILFRKDCKEPLLYQAQQTIAINYRSLVNFCEKIIPLIRNGGRVVNISSSSGHLSRIPSEDIKNRIADPTLTTSVLNTLMDDYVKSVENGTYVEDGWGDSPYVVSKVAVNAYTFILQREMEVRDVKMNCVHPGYVASDMTAQVGDLTPEQGARVPLHLALRCGDDVKGSFFWHNGTRVPWGGVDPRGYIDNKQTPLTSH